MDQIISSIFHQPPWLPTCVLTFFHQMRRKFEQKLKADDQRLIWTGDKVWFAGCFLVVGGLSTVIKLFSWIWIWLVSYQRPDFCPWMRRNSEQKLEADDQLVFWIWDKVCLAGCWLNNYFAVWLESKHICIVSMVAYPWFFPRPGEAAATRPPSSESKKG